MSHVEVRLSTPETAQVVKNLYPLYLHDLSPYNGAQPNPFGILEDDPQVQDLVAQGEVQNGWWASLEKGIDFPHLIYADGKPIGFAMMAKGIATGSSADHTLEESFVLRSYRGTGIAQEAARQLFARFAGSWEMQILPRNLPTQAFWRKLIGGYSGMREFTRDSEGFAMVVVQFSV